MELSVGRFKCRLEIALLAIVLFWILLGSTLCSCCRVDLRRWLFSSLEGFATSAGPSFSSVNKPGYYQPPSSWSMPTLTYTPGAAPSSGVGAIFGRPQQPIPLPEGESDMFATTQFKPECCPNAYSTSTGCACMTVEQYNFLQNRGGNNVPYSEY